MTVAAPPFVHPVPPAAERLLTAADVALFPSDVPSGPLKYELHDGRLAIMAPPGDEHSKRQHILAFYLHLEAVLKGLGEARSEIGIILRRDPDLLLSPDAAIILKKSLPAKVTREGYLETIPEIVIEIRSKNDTAPEIRAKIDTYLAVGVKLAWVIDDNAASISAFEPDGTVKVFHRGDLLATPLLPGFAVAVENILEY